jgi:hypothetical protein
VVAAAAAAAASLKCAVGCCPWVGEQGESESDETFTIPQKLCSNCNWPAATGRLTTHTTKTTTTTPTVLPLPTHATHTLHALHARSLGSVIKDERTFEATPKCVQTTDDGSPAALSNGSLTALFQVRADHLRRLPRVQADQRRQLPVPLHARGGVDRGLRVRLPQVLRQADVLAGKKGCTCSVSRPPLPTRAMRAVC